MGTKGKIAEKQLKLEIGLATRPSIAKWQFQKSFLFFLGVWVKLVTLLNGRKLLNQLTLGSRNIDSWLEQKHVITNVRMSKRSGQSELKRCIHLTNRIAHFMTWMVANCWINWHLALAKCMTPSGLSHRLCCDNRTVKICVAGCFNCTNGLRGAFSSRSDTAFAYYITVYHWQPAIQYNVVQTWKLTAPLFEFANVCSWFIWVHSP